MLLDPPEGHLSISTNPILEHIHRRLHFLANSFFSLMDEEEDQTHSLIRNLVNSTSARYNLHAMRTKYLGIILILSIFAVSSAAIAQTRLKKKWIREAMFYKKLPDGSVRCELCPRRCIIPEGERGYCQVRFNKGGVLYTMTYGNPAAVHIDPIEKKPFFHFLPGSKALSIATAGCNLRCNFCQNWQLSQTTPEYTRNYDLPPDSVVAIAKRTGCEVIAYTYSEPTIFYEYMYETAKLAHKAGIKNVMLTCGYIEPEPLRELAKYLDAIDIDLKGFSDDVYRYIGKGRLKYVLRTAKVAKEAGLWIEITYLVIPTLSDSEEQIRRMARWVVENLGDTVPVHFLRFHPHYKLTNLPPTPVSTLERAIQIAKEEGLKFVYIGNVPGHPAENTYCPRSGKVAIRRRGFFLIENKVDKNGYVKECGERLPGVWK